MALSLSASAYAQTSQTFYFGEGQTHFGESQSTPQRGHAPAAPPSTGETPSHAKPKAQAQPQARSRSKSKHRQRHRPHTTSYSPLQNPYSRP
jgi:hypothetical protein